MSVAPSAYVTRARPGALRRPVAILMAATLILGAWFAAGILRSADVALGYFVGVHQGQALANVTVDGAGLSVLPPFWQVSVSGDVIEPPQTWVSYRSYMRIWVEPLTGLAFANGAG